MTTVDEMLARIKAREAVACPHCAAEADMTDCERLQGHVTYWGEEEPQPITCSSCGADFFLKEHVTRTWSAGRTAEEADEL